MPVRFNAKLFSLCLSATVFAAGCGGSNDNTVAQADPPSAQPSPPPFGVPGAGDPAPAPAPTPTPPMDGTTSTTACTAVPPLPTRPTTFKSVADFGAVPNDGVDDTAAIQRALDSLQPGEWLVFPPGRYLHSKSLHMRVANTVMWGDGATLQATNPNDMAVWLEASGASVYKFKLTAQTSTRGTTPWQARITIYGGSNPRHKLSGNVIRGNHIVQDGGPGTPLANSASAAGIFIYYATNFLVAENVVSRSLADAIHITAGSSYGKVLNNMVREPGDDMIAVVSYLGNSSTSASTIASSYDARKASDLSHHITIANNDVSGQYWGRGITVVGGENVTIENNKIDKPTHGAAIYLARETSYLTFGVKNVLVRNNTITDVQTTLPAYVAGDKTATATKTGQGGVEIYSFVFTDEAAIGWLNSALGVSNVRVENNTMSRTATAGTRIGNGWGRTWGASGRTATGGPVGLIGFTNNKMTSIGSAAIDIKNRPTASFNIACSGNTDDGNGTSNGLCSGSPPPVTPACT